MFIKIAEAAARYKVSRQYLQKLITQGKIATRKRRNRVEVDTESGDMIFNVTSEPEPQEPEPKPKETPKQANPQDNLFISQKGLTPVTKVDIALKMTKIEAQKIRNKIDTGRLIEREGVEAKFFEIARKVRDSLESIPARTSGLCEGKTKHEIEQVLIKEIKQVLTNLVNNI
jgi:hypothetical protein